MNPVRAWVAGGLEESRLTSVHDLIRAKRARERCKTASLQDPGHKPASARPVLERMELDVENWVGTVEKYGSLYWRVAGKVENLKKKAQEMGQRWLAGQRKSRGVFRQPRGSGGRKARDGGKLAKAGAG